MVVYADEVDIELNPRIGFDYMLPGSQKEVPTPGKNEKRYVAGALDSRTGRLVWVDGERKRSELFVRLVHALVDTYKEACVIHVILDNASIHESQYTRAALAELGGRVRLHFLPPYCQDGNRIERLWRDLHENVTYNHRCETMTELMAEVRNYLANRSRSNLMKYYHRRRRRKRQRKAA